MSLLSERGALPAGPPKVADFTALDPQAIAKVTEVTIMEASEQYRPAASRGSLMYFLLSDLFKVHQTVDTAGVVVAPPLTSGPPSGSHWLGAALHAPEEPPRQLARSQRPWCCL